MSETLRVPQEFGRLQKKIEEKIAEICAIENYFPGVVIIHDIKKSTVVYMSQWGRDYLGVTNADLQKMGTDYYNRFFNIDEAKDFVPKILGLLERNNDAEFISHFQQVRRSPEHDWVWYLTATRIFFRDEKGMPLLTLTTSLPVDAQHHIAAKAQRLLEENNFLRNNHHIFNLLTKREKEILRLMAMGQSSEEMANKLHISETTASTHRRNIKRKLKIESNYDVIRFAQSFDLI
jgi:DNA-binding CsgD family transcriptional regulator